LFALAAATPSALGHAARVPYGRLVS